MASLSSSPFALADRTWDGGAGANTKFETPTNWNGDVAPIANETIIFGPNATYTVSFDAATGARTQGLMQLQQGNVTFQGNAATANVLTLASGVLLNTGRLQLNNIDYRSNQTIGMWNGARVDLNAGSKITVGSASQLTLGYNPGTPECLLTMAAGTSVTGGAAFIGHLASTSGRVQMTGANTLWSTEFGFWVGRFGNGFLEMSAGARINNTSDGYVGWTGASVSTATLTGTGTTWTNTRDLYLGSATGGGTGTLTINAGSRINVGDAAAAIPVNGYNYIGDVTTPAFLEGGTMYVYNGSQLVDNTSGFRLGNTLGTSGRIVISGTNSKLTTPRIEIGSAGAGVTTVSAGGTLSSVDIDVGNPSSNSTGSATLTVDGAASSVRASSTIFVGNGGSQSTLTSQNSGRVFAGDGDFSAAPTGSFVVNESRGYSQLSFSIGVTNGALIAHNAGGPMILGLSASKNGGAAALANGRITGTGELIIGQSGNGKLTADSGGQVVFDGTITMDTTGTGTGVITLDDANTRFATKRDMILHHGTTTNSSSSMIGVGDVAQLFTQAGQITIADSTPDIGDGFIGGHLTVGVGATLTNNGTISVGPDANGTVFGVLAVGATGATLVNNGTINVGKFGEIILAAGGKITASSMILANGGKVSLTGGELRPDFLNVASFPSGFVMSGTGKLVTPNISASTTVFTQTGGIVSPGGPNATGFTNVTGGYTQQANGLLEYDIIGNTNDAMFTTTTVNLAGTLALTVSGTQTIGSSHIIIGSNTGLTGKFSNITGVNVSPNLAIAVVYDNFSVTYRPSLPGDATLDNKVNFDDLVTLAQLYNLSSKTWTQGDFTGDGKVNFDDLVIIAQHYNQSITPPLMGFESDFAADWALAQSLVPEPTTLALLPLALLAVRTRRR